MVQLRRGRPDTSDEFLTVAGVAAMLKLNQQTIRNWIDAGKLPALRVGRRVRVIRRDLDELLDQSRTASAEADNQLVRTPEDFWGG